jgi:hypothetical protein
MGTDINVRRAALVAKAESTYGADSTPAGADALLVSNLRVSPLKTALTPRNNVLPWFVNQGQVLAARWSEIDFDVEMAGAGAAGTAAPYAAVLKACSLAETLSGGVDAQYVPVSSSPGSVTLKYYEDGVRHNMLGCRGNAQWAIKNGGLPMISFHFLGLFVTAADASVVAPTLTGFQRPVAVNYVNTTPFTLDSYAAVFSDLMLDLGNDVRYVNRPNFEGIRMMGRKSTARVTFEKNLVADKGWMAMVGSTSTYALTCTHGLTAGNICKLDALQSRIVSYDESEDNGTKMIALGLDLEASSAGNNEMKFTVK